MYMHVISRPGNEHSVTRRTHPNMFSPMGWPSNYCHLSAFLNEGNLPVCPHVPSGLLWVRWGKASTYTQASIFSGHVLAQLLMWIAIYLALWLRL